jgi:hypothetical protein
VTYLGLQVVSSDRSIVKDLYLCGFYSLFVGYLSISIMYSFVHAANMMKPFLFVLY